MPTPDVDSILTEEDIVWFDLEYTLFGFLFNHSLRTDLPPHLRPFTFEGLVLPYKTYSKHFLLPGNLVIDLKGNFIPIYHAIYQDEMGAIFRALIASNKKIAFITRSLLKPELVKLQLEKLYKLEPNSLEKCVYICPANTPELYNENRCKAEFIQKQIDSGSMGKNPKITFVDDNDVSEVPKAKAKPYCYNAIDATGQLDPRPFKYALQKTNPVYLKRIIEALNLLEHMPDEDQQLFVNLKFFSDPKRTYSLSYDSVSCASSVSNGDVVLFREVAPPRTISAVPEGDEDEEQCCWTISWCRPRLKTS